MNTLKMMQRFATIALVAVALVSCEDTVVPPVVPPTTNNDLTVIEGNITANTTLDATKKYLLKGKVFVQAPAVFTVPAGTIIFGDKATKGALIINRGAKIMAEGTATSPIVFTSNAPVGYRNRGDWAGIVICGNSDNNGNPNSSIEGISATGTEDGLYGPGTGAAINDQNSGTMRFVRIEFAGQELSPDNELNSLTMGSVGSGTIIENIVVSFANDDAYEWFGGYNNAKYLIAISTWDDDFDTDRGFSGKIQYGLVLRDANIADKSGSRAFEASSNSNAGANPHSAAEFANITVVGPRLFSATINANYQAAVEINSNSALKVHNSILSGFATGIRFNGAGAGAAAQGNYFFRNTANTALSGGSTLPANFATANVVLGDSASFVSQVWADAPSSIYTFNPLLSATSPLNAGALPVAGFEAATHVGGFGSTANAGWNWGTAWIELNPVNKVY
jgi:hypothetical protein